MFCNDRQAAPAPIGFGASRGPDRSVESFDAGSLRPMVARTVAGQPGAAGGYDSVNAHDHHGDHDARGAFYAVGTLTEFGS